MKKNFEENINGEKNFKDFSKKNKTKADEYIKNPEKLNNLYEEAKKKAEKKKGPLGEMWANISLAIDLIKDWKNGVYRSIPVGSLSMIIIAIIYFISPVDAILDTIPFLGFLDDAAVLGFVLKQVESDIEEYKQWKTNN